ncbi:MAG: MFS transporter [Chloroflexi bacterium]|nr:MFS transporter [Chloroflexota bacterium]
MDTKQVANKTAVAAEDKLDFKRILPIFVIVLIDLLGLTIIIPLMPLYAASFNASPAVIGMLGATYPVMQFIGAPILGRLSDKYGRKPILVISQIGTLSGFLLLGVANTLPLLFLSRIIDGISGANIATAQAAITDSTTEKTRTQGLGLIGAAFGLGFIVGPVIAFVALALTNNNYHAPAFAAAAFSFLSILLTIFWFKETLPEEKRGQGDRKPTFSFAAMAKALSYPTVGILLILMFAQQLAFGGFEQLLSLFTLNRLGLNAAGNSIIFVYIGVIVVAVQGGLIGKWSRKYGDRRLIYGGLALLAVGLILLGLTPRNPVPWYSQTAVTEELGGNRTLPGETPPTQNISLDLPNEANKGWLGFFWLMVAVVPASIGGGILSPAINSLITKRVRNDEIGGILGISSSFVSAANALGPLLGGFVFQALGASAPFVAGGVLSGLMLALALQRVKPGQEEQMKAGLARGGGH